MYYSKYQQQLINSYSSPQICFNIVLPAMTQVFYPRDAMLARVFATATCPSVCLSVTRRYCHFQWPWVTPDPSFKVTVLLKGEYLENGAYYTQSYHRTVIGNHMQAIDWCQFRWPWVTPDLVFKVTVVLKGEYLENGAFYAQSYYRTVIGNHMQAIEWCHFRWPCVTPDPSFMVTAVLKGEYLQSDAFYRQLLYRT